METRLAVLLIYLAIINLIAFCAMGVDKGRAKKRGRRRLSERSLFLLCALGGALGAWIGMRVWHHKTKHRSFTIGVPLLLIVNLVMSWYIAGWLGYDLLV
ncbi:DUF1294 domain-containing protein [Paenibacillus sp. GCM10023252]|uniref:DUF1294 domain-containing protein n=1 Tax=Paenibacillus sp. GCM10023252 TaxID=3252649 RepID=UPI00360FCA8C